MLNALSNKTFPSYRPERHEPFAVGRGDLDPLGGGVGGMMMDPRGARGPRFGMNPPGTFPIRLPP